MNLDDLQRHWDAFGRTDPLWAILTDPARKGGRWTPAEFFATGVAEVAALLGEARRFALPERRRRGLDFGCGVGRLTQALAEHVDEAIGLDVAPSMIAHARAANRHGTRVRYQVQAGPPLTAIADRSIDVVLTGRVLQHIAPDYARVYVTELARVLAPGGFLSFDLPSRPLEAPPLPSGAMPAGAYLAELTARWLLQGRGVVEVAVTNRGAWPWPAGLPLNVGNHWRAADGAMLVVDDQRAPVPLPLAPAATAVVELSVAWPPPAGATVLEVDVVHEGVTWFADLGSPAARVEVAGTPGPSAPARPTAPAGFEPVMEMHAVPRPEVEALLAAAGVRLLQVRAETHCGPRWEAWRYDVTADGRR
ncbi:MAG: class I SAM-dependent methyltransferase [Vicinamibacterales bacterium]